MRTILVGKLAGIGVIILLIFIRSSATAQTIYDVTAAGQVVGTVKVFSSEEKEEEIFRRIEADFSFLFYSGSFLSENHFSKGKLKSSSTEHFSNGKQKEKTVTTGSSGNPRTMSFVKLPEEKKVPKELPYTIENTITDLYYQEPAGVKTVFSERYGQMCQVQSLGDNRYGIRLPNGKVSKYTYVAGRCQEVETELVGIKLRIVRRETLNRLSKR